MNMVLPKIIRPSWDPERAIGAEQLRWIQNFNPVPNPRNLPPLCEHCFCTNRARSMWVDSEGKGYCLCTEHQPSAVEPGPKPNGKAEVITMPVPRPQGGAA